MSLNALEKDAIVKKYGINEKDTGRVEVQIALLTADIVKLTQHFQTHKKDNHSRRGLLRKVNLRRSFLTYLKKHFPERYREIVSALELRG